MHFSQLGAVAALAAIGQAFLLPPTISKEDSEIVNTLPFDTETPIDGRLVAIECPGCPVYITNIEGQTKAASGRVDSLLRFNFSLEHGDRDQLKLNGVQLYPLDPESISWVEPLTADQLVKTSDGTWAYAATPMLGYEFSAEHLKSSDKDQMDLVAVRIQIVEIDGDFISGFPYINLRLLETPSGKLMIGDVAITDANVSPSKPADGNQECTTLLCKWRAIIADKMSKLKGCGGKRPQQGTGNGALIKGTRPKPIPGHARPRPAHGSHRHHGHHRHRHGGFARSFAKVLRNIVFHVFIPIVIGVFVGITASLVGMVVGHIAIFIWRTLFRRGQRGQYQRVQAEESEAKDDEDSKSLLGHDNPPPVYEDAPAYEEAVVEKV